MNARKRHGSLVGALGLVSIALGACGEYRWLWDDAGKPGSGNHAPKPGSGGAPACVDLAFDHDVACQDAPAAKDQAGADCRRRGLELTAFGPGSCVAGDLVRLEYTCCPQAIAPPRPPPPSDGGAPACVDVAFDHDVACEDAAAAKAQAGADCQRRGLGLTAFGPASCFAGDLVRLKYSCCPQADAPPPSSGGSIPPDPARYAQYRCCTSSTSCLVQQLGGPSACEDSAAFKAEASAACAKTGGTLTDVYLYVACSL